MTVVKSTHRLCGTVRRKMFLFLIDLNYRPGPLWIAIQQGSVMCRIRLGDGHFIVHHVDQLRHRVTTEHPATVESDKATDNVHFDVHMSTDTETVDAEPDSVEEPEAPPQPPPDMGAGAEVDVDAPSCQRLTEQSDDGVVKPPCSTRVRHPPFHYGEQFSHC